MYKVTHVTKTGNTIVEEETSLKWVNIIVAAVMRDGGTIKGIEKINKRGFQ